MKEGCAARGKPTMIVNVGGLCWVVVCARREWGGMPRPHEPAVPKSAPTCHPTPASGSCYAAAKYFFTAPAKAFFGLDLFFINSG